MSNTSVEPDNARATRVLVAMYIAAAFFGAVEPFLPRSEAGHFIALAEIAVFSLLLTYWCQLDSDNLGIRFPRWLLWLIVVAGLFAMPIYIYRARRARNAWKAAGLTAGVVLSMTAISIVAFYASQELACLLKPFNSSCSYR